MNIPNYTINRQIGEGGMATVYHATHNLLQKNVAIKVLKPAYVFNESIKKRFLTEARIMFGMSHPNIIKVTDMIDQDQVVGFIMEYVDGESLKAYIDRQGALDPAMIRQFFSEMLQAVDYVHEQGYVHRDLKPSNFMIDQKSKIKLLDFGISKVLNPDAQDHHLTATYDNMGTPMYMSPEQIKSSKEVTFRSDIYSLGVVLWQMVTGKRPYDSATLSTFDLQTKIVNEPLESTGTGFDAIIARATAKDPAARFSSCREFLDAMSGPSAKSSTARTEEPTVVVQAEPIAKPIQQPQVAAEPIKTASPTRKGVNPMNPISLVLGILLVIVLGIVNAQRQASIYEMEYETAVDADSFAVGVDTPSADKPSSTIRFHNNTGKKIFLALAYNNYGMESHGWYALEPNESHNLETPGGIADGKVYWYAKDVEGKTYEGMDKYLCVDPINAFDKIAEDEVFQCPESDKVWFRELNFTEGYNYQSIDE